MSRSFKKTPIAKDHDSGKFGKKTANRRVRRYKHPLTSGMAYKRIFETYDIHDCIIRYSRSDYLRDKESEEKQVQNGTRSVNYRMSEHSWAKYYKRK